MCMNVVDQESCALVRIRSLAAHSPQLCDFDRHKTVSILSLRHALLKESNIYRCVVSRNSRQHHRTHHRVTNQTNRAYKLSKYLNIYISHHRSPFTLPASRWEIPPTLLNNPITPNLSLPIPTPLLKGNRNPLFPYSTISP